jgi:hypothetical protein
MGKVKVKLSLYLTKHHAFLTSALDGCVWSASRPGCFSPKEIAPILLWRYFGILDGSGGRVRKYSFPRRRPTSTPSPVTTTQPVTTLPTTDTPKVVRGENQLPESKEQPSTVQEVHEEVTTTKLSDLANPAVVAIHNLATAPPTTQPSPEVLKSTRKFRHFHNTAFL